MADLDDEAAVRAVAADYYRSMVAGDEETLRRIFEPRAPVVGNFKADLIWDSVDSFVDEAMGLVGQHGTEETSIESVIVHGSIAVAVVGGRYDHLWFVDHLSMVKVEGVWRIAAKTFHVASEDSTQGQ